MGIFDALSGPDSSSGIVSPLHKEQNKFLSYILKQGVDKKSAHDLGIDLQDLDVCLPFVCFLGKEKLNLAKTFNHAPPHFDKSKACPGHIVKKKGEEAKVLLQNNVVKYSDEWKNIDLYEDGIKVTSTSSDNFKFESYTKEQLITVSRIFQKNLEEYINKLKELKKEEEKRKKAIEKERKAGYVKLTRKANRNYKIQKELNDKQSETASKTNYISKRIMEENGRQYERIIKERRKIDEEFHNELIEIKEKTEEIHELRKEEDIKYKINETYDK